MELHSISRFTALIASLSGLTKSPRGHHGQQGHYTEETGLLPRAKAAPGNQGGPSLQRDRGEDRNSEVTHPPPHPGPCTFTLKPQLLQSQWTHPILCAHRSLRLESPSSHCRVVSTRPHVIAGLLGPCPQCPGDLKDKEEGKEEEKEDKRKGGREGRRKDKAFVYHSLEFTHYCSPLLPVAS